jgi:hypothetical protein
MSSPGDPVDTAARCQACGAPARVHVLVGYASAQPVRHAYCFACLPADSEAATPVDPRQRLSLAWLLAILGMVLGTIGALADDLTVSTHAGFGWWQVAGCGFGMLMILLGGLLRVDLVAMGGLLLFAASASADWFGPRSPGVGYKQVLVLGISGICLAAAAIEYARARHGERRAAS